MTWRSIAIALLAAMVLAAAGCGGNGGVAEENDCEEGSSSAVCAAPRSACGAAKQALLSTVSERDRLFVDLQLKEATDACAGELGTTGTTEKCTAARADLESAAAEETPPPDLEERVDAAVEACVGTTITSTIPAP